MKTAGNVSAEKLRGGFYTPDPLVDLCLERAADLAPPGDLTVIEPSAGDGAFFRGLGRSPLRTRVVSVSGLEPMEIEAEKSRRALRDSGTTGEVRVTSAIPWAAHDETVFDLAVGNPPFVRYQFISTADRAAIEALGQRLDLRFAGVGNLWIPVLVGALSRLRLGGAFAFVVPSELLTGISASLVRTWLIEHCESVRLDLFPPGSFPNVLQEVLVLSGVRSQGRPERPTLRITEQATDGSSVDWYHQTSDGGSWTKFLLPPPAVAALEHAAADPRVSRLGEVAAFEVSIVTGANDYFTVNTATVERFGLGPWTRPLLPRIRHASGLEYTEADHQATEIEGARASILDFAAERADPMRSTEARAYLADGESRGLHARYKCRIREPWYRVPGIRAGELLLSKRSHHYPRVVVNTAGVFTTDTIYRGRMLTSAMNAVDLAVNFHTSLTLLSAELEGRSFGGGVLELVPSEVGRLTVHTARADSNALVELDALARAGDAAALIEASDRSAVQRGLIEPDVMAELASAREALVQRRLDRNQMASRSRAATAGHESRVGDGLAAPAAAVAH